jgi:hypothetical protein
MSKERLLSKLLALEKHRERNFAIVWLIDLLKFNRVVRKEEIEDVELVSTVI